MTPGSDTLRLTQMSMSLKEKLDDLKMLDSKILNLVTDEKSLADEIEQADHFKESIYATIVKIRKYPSGSSSHASSPSRDGTDPPSWSPHVHRVKLSVRPLNGDITGGQPSGTPINQPSVTISISDKSNYLRSLLEHTTLKAISGLTLTSTNYLEAVEILGKHFWNK